MKKPKRTTGGGWARLLLLPLLLSADAVRARTFTIETVAGPVDIEVNHLGLADELIVPSTPGVPGFGPPTIFSAPLPSGSGARALGLAGSFTAVADDATAASWNPAGLIQLERPEASIVWREQRERNRHRSDSGTFRVGEDSFDDSGLNYFSAVWPFRLLDRNWVFSANYQEAYDFTEQFHADLSATQSRRTDRQVARTYNEVSTVHVASPIADIYVERNITTHTTSTLSQLLTSDLVSDLAFDQDGLIDAVSPALAVQLTPKISLGTAVNFYSTDFAGAHPIRARTVANYSGTTESLADITTVRTTEGTYSYQGVIHVPAIPALGLPAVDTPFSSLAPGEFPAFTDTFHEQSRSSYEFRGQYDEETEYRSMGGVNATLGLLATVARWLDVGLAVDLPWTASGEQEQTIRNSVATYAEGSGQVVDQAATASTEVRDVDFHFPLYWALGTLWRWNNRFYTTLDVSQTQWSDFWYESTGSGRINPLDGSAAGEHPLRDCWAIRSGLEYLLVYSWTEIPLRGGVSWEQRPAIGAPDEYWGVSVGSGISLGKDPGKLIIDFAYLYTWGDDVMSSLVPGQTGLTTDVTRHQVFVSSIWHF